MKEIKLNTQRGTKGKYVALVDDEDFERVNQFRWYAAKNGNTFYPARMIRIGNSRVLQYLHWDVMGCKGIDHIDRNGLNDQKLNLRKCSHQQNMQNRRSSKNSTSKYKGVSWYKSRQRWLSRIKVNYIIFYLGLFKDEIKAAKAYDEKAKELFGEFAYLNFKEIQMKRTKF